MAAVTTAAPADYAHLLDSLLPAGPAWHTGDGVLGALGDGLTRVHGRAVDAVGESQPASATELFAEWEYAAGLPDACVGAGQTLAQRRDALVARITAHGGQSPAYYVGVAAALGYPVTITEFRPHTVASAVTHPLYDHGWSHAWQVNAPLNNLRRLTVISGVDEPLASWANTLLECVIRRLKPAHALVLFAYT